MTAPDLSAIRAQLAGITPGPWKWDEEYGDKGDTGLALTNDSGAEIIGAYNHHCCSFRDDPNVESEADAAFIAAAPSTVTRLLGIVERTLSIEPIKQGMDADTRFANGYNEALRRVREAIGGEPATGGMAAFQEALGDYYDSGMLGDPPEREDYPIRAAITGEGGA